MALGNRIREFRQSRGKSLGEVADAVGMDRAHLHRVERGLGGCADEKMVALARYFDVPITDLFFQEIVDSTPTSEEVTR